MQASKQRPYEEVSMTPPLTSPGTTARRQKIELHRDNLDISPIHTVFVRNLSSKISSSELESLAHEFGPTSNIFSRVSQKGIAFLTFQDLRDAKKAVEGLECRVIKGREIHTSYAYSSPDNKVDPRSTCSTITVKLMDNNESNISLESVSTENNSNEINNNNCDNNNVESVSNCASDKVEVNNVSNVINCNNDNIEVNNVSNVNNCNNDNIEVSNCNNVEPENGDEEINRKNNSSSEIENKLSELFLAYGEINEIFMKRENEYVIKYFDLRAAKKAVEESGTVVYENMTAFVEYNLDDDDDQKSKPSETEKEREERRKLEREKNKRKENMRNEVRNRRNNNNDNNKYKGNYGYYNHVGYNYPYPPYQFNGYPFNPCYQFMVYQYPNQQNGSQFNQSMPNQGFNPNYNQQQQINYNQQQQQDYNQQQQQDYNQQQQINYNQQQQQQDYNQQQQINYNQQQQQQDYNQQLYYPQGSYQPNQYIISNENQTHPQQPELPSANETKNDNSDVQLILEKLLRSQ